MALETFKEIVERKGYLVENEDRKIFEKEIKKSNFGLGVSDMIEFILYDSNDNQLPQGEDAKLVRYIHIDDKNINDYFLITRNAETKKTNDAAEFIIDLERLIREAGYSNGIFKTQITLLNRRIGSEEGETDKLWIHEISPTRTEIRVVPLKNTNKPNEDLLRRYGLFTDEGNFRDDTIYYVRNFIDSIDIFKVVDRFIRSKGRIRDGRRYQKLVQQEFKVGSFDNLLNDIKARYLESMDYFIVGKDWDITSNTYGKSINNPDLLELTISKIKRVAETAIRNSVEYYLPKRKIQNSIELTADEQITFDKVKKILKTIKANQKFPSTIPSEVGGVVRGCTDKEALNYNPRAKENDGSCRYKETEVAAAVVEGCTDKSAVNYNQYANKDDGSCKYQEVVEDFADLGGGLDTDTEVVLDPPPPPPPKPVYKYTTKIYYVWSETGSINYTDRTGGKVVSSGIEYDALKITFRDDGPPKFVNDVREIPKIKITPPLVVEYRVQNQSRVTRQRPEFLERKRFNDIHPFGDREGYNRRNNRLQKYPNVIEEFEEIFVGSSLSFSYKNKLNQQKTSSTIEPNDSLIICAVENSISSVPGLKVTRVGTCGGTYPQVITVPKPKYKCNNSRAINFGEVGVCKYAPKPVDPIIPPPPPPPPPRKRCLDPNADNYRQYGTCTYPIFVDVVDKPIQIVRNTPPRITGGNSGGSRGGGGGGSREVQEILDAMGGDFSGGIEFNNRNNNSTLRMGGFNRLL
jgi:hypothetical protein